MNPGSSKSSIPLTLKLLVDKTANKVLFAEASKEFVDFLFTLLALPVATVVHLLAAPNMVGSVGNIYTSMAMNATYLQPNLNKEALLNPKISTNSTAVGPLRLTMETLPDTKAPIGYVQSAVAYMVMDDLSFSPMSTISGITLLNRFSVTDLRSLEERDVEVGMDEKLKLLKASFQSKTVLSDVFLPPRSRPMSGSLMKGSLKGSLRFS